ncbi:MAG: hypothetical protein ACI91R_000942 [Vicingaceae bacterium]|jgi:hypothetical protein|tara:strand:+ start:236 stop:460 length:225 start_codon:yes stop_codon:yes gene_type:complete
MYCVVCNKNKGNSRHPYYFSAMNKKDKTKVIIALITFGSIFVSYFIWGKEIAKYIAVAGFAVWFGSMYFLNKKV